MNFWKCYRSVQCFDWESTWSPSSSCDPIITLQEFILTGQHSLQSKANIIGKMSSVHTTTAIISGSIHANAWRCCAIHHTAVITHGTVCKHVSEIMTAIRDVIGVREKILKCGTLTLHTSMHASSWPFLPWRNLIPVKCSIHIKH